MFSNLKCRIAHEKCFYNQEEIKGNLILKILIFLLIFSKILIKTLRAIFF